MQTGTIDPVNKTIDIHDVSETETSILLTGTQLSLTWRNAAGELIRLTKLVDNVEKQYVYTKPIDDPRTVQIGTKLLASTNGYLEPGKRGSAIGKALTNIDWTDLSNFTTDGTGAMIPITLSS